MGRLRPSLWWGTGPAELSYCPSEPPVSGTAGWEGARLLPGTWGLLGCRSRALVPAAGGRGSSIPDLLSSSWALPLCPPASPTAAPSPAHFPSSAAPRAVMGSVSTAEASRCSDSPHLMLCSAGAREKRLLRLQARLHGSWHGYLPCPCQSLPETFDGSIWAWLFVWFSTPRNEATKSTGLVRASPPLGIGVRCLLKGQ